MDEKIKEIEEEIADAHLSGNMVAAEFTVTHIEYLLQKVKELRARVAELEEWCGSYKDI